jgi:hypothetical protein
MYFLKEQTIQPDIKPIAPEPIIEEQPGIKPELSLREIALIYVYENNPITRDNCHEIAVKNKYTSGEKLYQHYSYYSSRANRTAKASSLKTFDNKIKLFTGILDSLSSEAKLRASDEINTLKAAFDRQDF